MGSSFPSSTPNFLYDVFLNFRGNDTRESFANPLHDALELKGINSFIDSKLGQGKDLDELLEVIKQSRNAVVVLSKDYASSEWCLNELTVILERRTEIGLKVLPVFYHVDPSDVQEQRGSFEHSTHKVDSEEAKAAFKAVSQIAGWIIDNSTDKSVIIEEICREVEQTCRPDEQIRRQVEQTRHQLEQGMFLLIFCFAGKNWKLLGDCRCGCGPELSLENIGSLLMGFLGAWLLVQKGQQDNGWDPPYAVGECMHPCM